MSLGLREETGDKENQSGNASSNSRLASNSEIQFICIAIVDSKYEAFMPIGLIPNLQSAFQISCNAHHAVLGFESRQEFRIGADDFYCGKWRLHSLNSESYSIMPLQLLTPAELQDNPTSVFELLESIGQGLPAITQVVWDCSARRAHQNTNASCDQSDIYQARV